MADPTGDAAAPANANRWAGASYEAAFNSDRLVVGVTPEAFVQALNPAAVAAFAWSGGELKDRPLALILPVGPAILSALAAGDAWAGTGGGRPIRAQTRTGSPFLVALEGVVDRPSGHRLLVFTPRAATPLIEQGPA